MLHVNDLFHQPDAFDAIESFFQADTWDELERRYQLAIDALGSSEPEDWLAAEGASGVDPAHLDHFRDDWLGEGGFWPSIDRSVRVEKMRRAYVDAFAAAIEGRLPVTWVWLTPFAGTDIFEVETVVNRNAVVITFITSLPKSPPVSQT